MSANHPAMYDADSRNDPDFPWFDIDDQFCFPDPDETQGSVVAVGGNLSPGMLVSAYTQGIFPWFNEDDPLYWQSPDPRFVILGETFHVPSRLARAIRQHQFSIRTDTSFHRVINFCSGIAREGQNGTWITDDIIEAYTELHRQGLAHSVEAWQGDKLVGGFYGVLLGKVFFGESMFTRVPDASKTAFAVFARHFFTGMGGRMIDSQVYTDHIARFGGQNISRSAYLRKLADALGPVPDLLENRSLWQPDMLGGSLTVCEKRSGTVQLPGGVNL
jgi:leucyl/phenylalanyl-tRNA--protein transferase